VWSMFELIASIDEDTTLIDGLEHESPGIVPACFVTLSGGSF